MCLVRLSKKELGTFFLARKQYYTTALQTVSARGHKFTAFSRFCSNGNHAFWCRELQVQQQLRSTNEQRERERERYRLSETMANVIDNKGLSATWGQWHTSFGKKQPKNPQKFDAMEPEWELPPIPPIPLQGQDLLLQLPGSRPKCLLCLDDLSAMQQCMCHCGGNI